jgi:imidazolonepropionase-like amidohydrolase
MDPTVRSRAAWLWSLACLVAVPAHAEKADVYALVGAKVFTVSGPVLESATVVLRDGLVEAVGTGVAVPRDARVIEAKGLVLTPGLIDAFSGAGLPAAPARAPGGGGGGGGGAPASPPASSALAPQSLIIEKVRPSEALKARDNGITTVLVVPREGVLPGRSVLLNLSGEKAESMALKQPAALHLHLSTLARQYPGSLMGTVAMARQALYDGQRYREEWAAYEKAPAGKKRPKYDSAAEAWAEVASGRLPLWVTASRENDVRRALALADEFKIKVAVLGAPQAYRAAALIKSRKLPLVVSVNFDPPRAASFFGAADEEKEKRDIEEAEKNPAELHKAGVSFALGSGHAKDFLAGVRKAVEMGLPREAALRAITLSAAETLGVADRTGSLDRGKVANLVAWSGEPLTKDAKVKMVFVDGQLYEPEERPERRDEKGDDKKPENKPDTPPAEVGR